MIFSGCAFHNGQMVSSVALSSGNFFYVKKDVRGTSKATYVLGFGGLSKRALVDEAKKDLLSRNSLRDNQVLINLTVDWKKSFIFPLAITNRCIISADIVQFESISD